MIQHDHHDDGSEDPVLAGLVEQVTRRLQAGEVSGIDEDLERFPAQAGSIRSLLRVLSDLSALGRSFARRGPARSGGNANGRPHPFVGRDDDPPASPTSGP